MKRPAGALASAFVLLTTGAARAEEPAPPKRALYSLPFGLRGAIPATSVRSDTAFAYQGAATTVASTFTANAKITGDVSVALRAALVQNTPSGAAGAGNDRLVASNVLLSAMWSPQLSPSLRLPLFFGVPLPIGTGGGDDGSRAAYAANSAGIYARSGLDNALFSVNYVTLAAGMGLAYVEGGLTLQADATLLQLVRTRGEAIDPEPTRTNSTFACHAGYLVVDWLTLGVELRHQHFLSTPAAVSKDEARRDQTTALVGLRFNVPVASVFVRPGLAYIHPIDAPMATLDYRIVQLDVPVIF